MRLVRSTRCFEGLALLMKLRLAALLTLTLLSACARRGDILEGGGVYAVRSACPVAGVPAGTGDITLFNPPNSTDSRAIDVTATISDVRAVCQDAGNDVVSTTTFTITALRRDPGPARQVIAALFQRGASGDQPDRRQGHRQCRVELRAGRGAVVDPRAVDGSGQPWRCHLARERPPDPVPGRASPATRKPLSIR